MSLSVFSSFFFSDNIPPRKKRESKLLTCTDCAAKHEYLEGFVCKPALPKRLHKFFLIEMSEGLWIYHIRYKFANLLRRNRNRKADPNQLQPVQSSRKQLEWEQSIYSEIYMPRLPVYFYAFNDTGCLDPVVPFECAEVDRLEVDTYRGQRIMYDISLLEKLIQKAGTLLSSVSKYITVGSAWKLGELDTSEFKFVNSNGSFGKYVDLIPYSRYVKGTSKLTTIMHLTGLCLLSPKNPSIEYISDSNLDTVKVRFTSKGILCRMDLLKQSDCSEYVRNVSASNPNIVAFTGTESFPFNRVIPVDTLEDGSVYEAHMQMNSKLSEIILSNMHNRGFTSSQDSASLSFRDVYNAWQRITHPVWPLLSGTSSLTRVNCAIWSSVNGYLDLTVDEQSVLIIHQHLGKFSLTIESLPTSWTVTSVDISMGHDKPYETKEPKESKHSRVEFVHVTDFASLKDRHFDYVILSLCQLIMQSDGYASIPRTLEVIAPNVKAIVQFTFYRSMITEFPFTFRYLFGDTKLLTQRTTSDSQMFWIMSTEYCRVVNVPKDLDEASAYLHNWNFTLHPNAPPTNLSRYVPKMPDSEPWDLPVKLLVCTCYRQYSKFSPYMDHLAFNRNQDLFLEVGTTWHRGAAVGESGYYLASNVNCKDSILHALFQAAAPVYMELRDEISRVTLVSGYKSWVQEQCFLTSDKVLQVCKGVHLIVPEAYEVCIFNMIQGGKVTATLLPRQRDTTRGITELRQLDKCVFILRVSEEIAYPLARKTDNGFCMIHSTSELSAVGQSLSGMINTMVRILPQY